VEASELARLRKTTILPEKLVVGTVCGLAPGRGLDLFLECAKRVLDKVPAAYFLVAGRELKGASGFVRNLRSQASMLGIGNHVVFADPMADLNALYGLMQVFAFFSQHEASGRTAAKAMMRGLPVVARAWVRCPKWWSTKKQACFSQAPTWRRLPGTLPCSSRIRTSAMPWPSRRKSGRRRTLAWSEWWRR